MSFIPRAVGTLGGLAAGGLGGALVGSMVAGKRRPSTVVNVNSTDPNAVTVDGVAPPNPNAPGKRYGRGAQSLSI